MLRLMYFDKLYQEWRFFNLVKESKIHDVAKELSLKKNTKVKYKDKNGIEIIIEQDIISIV